MHIERFGAVELRVQQLPSSDSVFNSEGGRRKLAQNETLVKAEGLLAIARAIGESFSEELSRIASANAPDEVTLELTLSSEAGAGWVLAFKATGSVGLTFKWVKKT